MTITTVPVGVGAAAKDGTGDKARVAFQSVNTSIANLKAAGEALQGRFWTLDNTARALVVGERVISETHAGIAHTLPAVYALSATALSDIWVSNVDSNSNITLTPATDDELFLNGAGQGANTTVAIKPGVLAICSPRVTDVSWDVIILSDDQTAAEIEAAVNHDNLVGFVANEHIDWTATPAGKSIAPASGQGIDYTAAGGTILSQHKKGTFTGTLSGAGAGGTPVTATGDYEKTGNKMHIEIYFQNISTASMTGELEITGMPEAAAHRAVGVAWLKGVTATEVGQNPVIDPGTKRVYLMLSGSTAVQNVSAGASRYCRLVIDYLV